ncbi:MAG: electron transfer flavoprotein subunit beta/FixA family protein [Candidatus Hodarchaeota archaeon]
MKIIVCIKQVPGITEVKIDPKTRTLIREGIPSILNPMDKNAVELALSFKDEHGAEVIALSMGPPQARDVLIEAMAMGADGGYLLTDKQFAGADTLATSYTLSCGIKKILDGASEYLVICGGQAIDGDTAQVGPELAEELGIPSITNVQKATLRDGKIITERALEDNEINVLETGLPALITVLRETNKPRFATLQGIQDAFEKKEVVSLALNDLQIDKSKIGLTGSRTQVWKVFVPEKKKESVILTGPVDEVVKKLGRILKEKGLI